MSDNSESKKKGQTYSGVMILIGIIIGLLMFYFGYGIIPVFCVPITLIGVYLIISSFNRDTVPDFWGTSASGAALLWGFFMIAIGGAGLVYMAMHSVIISVVFALVILVLYLLARKH